MRSEVKSIVTPGRDGQSEVTDEGHRVMQKDSARTRATSCKIEISNFSKL